MVAAVDYQYWVSLIPIMYIVTIAFLLFVFTAEARFGSARWLEVGTILIQPAEIAKIVVILALANFFANHTLMPKKPRNLAQRLAGWWNCALDFPTAQSQYDHCAAGHLGGFSLDHRYPDEVHFHRSGHCPFGPFNWFVDRLSFLQDYQKDRISNFLFPDPEASYGETYNVDQALITIGTGGWFGQGYSQSTQVQLRFLKVRHTDFIFLSSRLILGLSGRLLSFCCWLW